MASTGKTKSANESKSKNGAPREGKTVAAKSKAKTAAKRELTGVEIGHVAGEVWASLDKGGEQTLAAIKKSIPAPAEVVVAAIGWLAREDKLEFVTNGATVKIGLRYRH
jgi:Winged helix-turn-helix domain (DUF2582)